MVHTRPFEVHMNPIESIRDLLDPYETTPLRSYEFFLDPYESSSGP